MSTRRREEAFNTRLADGLEARGIDAEAEVIGKHGGKKKLPDVQLRWFGIPIVIECKFDSGAPARRQVEEQARERLAQSFGSVAVAVLYPPSLRDVENIAQGLEEVGLLVKFFAPGLESKDWLGVQGVSGLASAVDQARAQLAADDVVRDSVQLLREAVDSFARAARNQPGRLEALLGTVTVADAAGAGKGDEEAQEAAAKICGLAVVTAAILQIELARVDAGVPPFLRPEEAQDVRRALVDSWKKVLAHDYAAVFQVGLDVLLQLNDSDPSLGQALNVALDAAESIAAKNVIGRHDLIGRVYHSLLADAKYLATYFTSVPAATLLSHLVIDSDRWPDVDWAAEPAEFDFRIGDLACGTGTLLAAGLTTIRQVWAARRAREGKESDVDALGRRMIEANLWGMDVLAYAVQVCAATLLLSSAGSSVSKTKLYQMPFGGSEGRLGSLELLLGETQAALFGDRSRLEIGLDESFSPTTGLSGPPELDLIVMNPPFTRSVHSSQLLGSLQGLEFTSGRKRLAGLVKQTDVAADLNAGLAAPFMELVHRCVRPGGRFAVILPKSVLTGESWEMTRRLIAQHWHLEHVVASHEAGHWNFSDSTDLSEVILIARKWRAQEDRAKAETIWVALWNNPVSPIDALGVASRIRRTRELSAGGVAFKVANHLAGEMFTRPAATDGKPLRHATFSRAALDAAAEALLEAEPVPLPGGQPVSIPLRPLAEIGSVGFDVRDVRDAFELTDLPTGYSGFWNHKSLEVTTLAQLPNRHLRPRDIPAAGRPLKDPVKVWASAARLMVGARLWLITHRCTAVVLDRPSVGSMWWPVSLNSDDPDDERIVAMWLNSTLGILPALQMSEETRGPLIQMKKNKLRSLPILDPGSLSKSSRRSLLKAWKEVGSLELSAISTLGTDTVRHAVDGAICDALGLDTAPLAGLREMLDAEPRLSKAVRHHDIPKKI